MSVLIKDMGKPKSCYAVIDGEFEYCPFVNTDDDCVLLLKKGTCEGTWEEQYSKCPLVETPEPCDDAVSREAAIDALMAWEEYSVWDEECLKHRGEPFWVAPSDVIKQLPPAQPDWNEIIVMCDCCGHAIHVKRVDAERREV